MLYYDLPILPLEYQSQRTLTEGASQGLDTAVRMVSIAEGVTDGRQRHLSGTSVRCSLSREDKHRIILYIANTCINVIIL